MHGTWKHPALLLSSVGISNLGAWVYFIALNLIVLERTNSAFAVSILYMLVPIAALLSSFWSGTVIDRVDKRNLMVLLDVSRAVLIAVLPWIDSLFVLYTLVFFINIGSSLFESASLIYMTKLVSKTNRQRFNALKNFIQSCGFILGPTIAGLLFLVGSPTFAIYLNAGALGLSALILFSLPDIEKQTTITGAERLSFSYDRRGLERNVPLCAQTPLHHARLCPVLRDDDFHVRARFTGSDVCDPRP